MCVMCSYVPALAVGFDDVQRRVEAQRAQSAAHVEKIKVRIIVLYKLINCLKYSRN